MDREQALGILHKILLIDDKCLQPHSISIDSIEGCYVLKFQCDLCDNTKKSLQEILDEENVQLKQEEDFLIIGKCKKQFNNVE